MSQPLDELFMASCGVFGPWNLSICGAGKAIKQRTFTMPYALVGRRDDSNLRLVHADVSRRHAYLQAFPGGVFCVDISARAGLRWHDEQRPWGWLRPGQPVQLARPPGIKG